MTTSAPSRAASECAGHVHRPRQLESREKVVVLTVCAWPRPPRPRVPTASLGHRLKPRRRASCPTLRLPQRQRAAAGRACVRPQPAARSWECGASTNTGTRGWRLACPFITRCPAASPHRWDTTITSASSPRLLDGRQVARCRSEDGTRWRTSTLGHRGRATRTASSALRRPPGERDGRGHACDHCAWLLADV